MRQIVTRVLYLLLVEVIAAYLVVFPVYAFQVSSSSTGYVRVATNSAIAAYQASQRAVFTSAVASAISAPTAASIAIRIATGPVGWGLLGVSAALVLANMYYSAQEIQSLKTAALAAQPTVLNIPGYTVPSGATMQNGCTPFTQGCTQTLTVANGVSTGAGSCGTYPQVVYPMSVGTPPPGWSALQMHQNNSICYDNFRFQYNGSNGQYVGTVGPPSTLSQAAATGYVNGLPANNPNSIESQTDPLGQGATVPSADNLTTVQVSPEQVSPTVKPAAQVLPTDAVIDPNAPPPTGPQPVTTPTITITTTTNPNGSTTTQSTEEPAVMSCSAGNHDQRSFGSVLQSHITLWQGSGLAGALNLIKNLTWPETVPTYAVASSIFGNFTIDFSGWSGTFLALRGLIIALASFVAYRIIFVGSK